MAEKFIDPVIWVILICAIGSSNTAKATIQGITLDQLNAGADITVANLHFTNWTVLVDDFVGEPVTLPAIDVLPLTDQPGIPGLQFNANGALNATDLDLIGFNLDSRKGSCPINVKFPRQPEMPQMTVLIHKIRETVLIDWRTGQ